MTVRDMLETVDPKQMVRLMWDESEFVLCSPTAMLAIAKESVLNGKVAKFKSDAYSERTTCMEVNACESE